MPEDLQYSIDSPDQPQLPFFVRNDSGELIAFAEIDREMAPKYEFRVVVSCFFNLIYEKLKNFWSFNFLEFFEIFWYSQWNLLENYRFLEYYKIFYLFKIN